MRRYVSASFQEVPHWMTWAPRERSLVTNRGIVVMGTAIVNGPVGCE